MSANPSTEPSYYNAANLHDNFSAGSHQLTGQSPATEGQFTYEAIGDTPSSQAASVEILEMSANSSPSTEPRYYNAANLHDDASAGSHQLAGHGPATEGQFIYEVIGDTSSGQAASVEISEISVNTKPSTGPSYYNNANLHDNASAGSHQLAGHGPAAEGQFTYEMIGETRSDRAAFVDEVNPTPDDIYQEIKEETHYQPLALTRQVDYEGFSHHQQRAEDHYQPINTGQQFYEKVNNTG